MNFPGQSFQKLMHEKDRQTDTHTDRHADRCNRICIRPNIRFRGC